MRSSSFKCIVLCFVMMMMGSGILRFEANAATIPNLALGKIQIRASKDARVFARVLANSETFQSTGIIDEALLPSTIALALRNENIFFAIPFTLNIIPSSLNATSSPVDMDITWSVAINGEDFPQETYVLHIDTSVVGTGVTTQIAGLLISTLPEDINSGEQHDDYLKVENKGTAEIEVFATISELDVEQNASISLLVITPFMSMFPLMMIIALALLSRNVYVALFFGIWIGSLVITNGDIVLSFKQLLDVHLIPSATASSNFKTMLFALFLGGFISQMIRSGGQEGFTILVGKCASSARLTQLAAVIAGVGLFFDDYSAVLILGASFKKLTDKFSSSREKLAFVVDSSAAPIASVAPLSSWIAFEVGLIKEELDEIRAAFDGSPLLPNPTDLPREYPFFLNTIPNRYYPLFTLALQFSLIIAGVEFGPMLLAERKCRIAKRTDGGDGAEDLSASHDLISPEKDTPRRAWNFFVPLGFFLVSLIVSLIVIGRENVIILNEETSDEADNVPLVAREIFGNTDSFAALVYTSLGAGVFSLFFYVIQFKYDGEMVLPGRRDILKSIDCRPRDNEDIALEANVEPPEIVEHSVEDVIHPRPLVYFTEGVNTWVEGFKNLIPAIIILAMAFTVKSIVSGCGTDRFFTDLITNSDIKAEAFPTIIFIVAALISFCTGTSFGTMSIMFPLVSFGTFVKANGDIELFTVALSSIMSGAVFGDHASLIADTTILASIGTGCKISAHVITQLPYALWAGFFAILIGTLPAGYGAPSGLMLFVGVLVIFICTSLVGAPVVDANGTFDVFNGLYIKATGSSSLKALGIQTKAFAVSNPSLVNHAPIDVARKIYSRVYRFLTGQSQEEQGDKEEAERILKNDNNQKNEKNDINNPSNNHIKADEIVAEL